MKKELINVLNDNNDLCSKEELTRFWNENNGLPDDEFAKALYEKYRGVDQFKTNAALRQMGKDVRTIKSILIVSLILLIVGIAMAFLVVDFISKL